MPHKSREEMRKPANQKHWVQAPEMLPFFSQLMLQVGSSIHSFTALQILIKLEIEFVSYTNVLYPLK